MKPITSETVYRFKHLSIVEDEIELSNGLITKHATVKHPGAVVIVPVTDVGTILFVRQYRHSVEKMLLELPAGALNIGEDPRQSALRELQEETGFSARQLDDLGQVYPAPGFCSEIQHFFLARNTFESKLPADEDEIIEVEAVKISEIANLMKQGTIEDGKSIVALTKAHLMGYLRCF